MSKVVDRMIDRMILDGTIEEEDKEIYEYGLTQGIIMLFNVIVTLLIGVLLHSVVETLLFMAVYMPLRSYAGGVHAKTQLRCLVYSFSMVAIILEVIKYFPNNLYIIAAMLVFSVVTVCLLAPVESENKPLDEDEVKRYGRKARLILFFYVGITILMMVLKWSMVYISLAILHLVNLNLLPQHDNSFIFTSTLIFYIISQGSNLFHYFLSQNLL